MLALTGNKFNGKIAVNFALLGKLGRVLLGRNEFGTGEHDEMNFITSLANQTNLAALDLAFNRLRGVIPNSVGNLSTNIWYIALTSNYLYGNLPPAIAGLSANLTTFLLEDNQFSGPIPSNIGNLQNLEALALDINEFSGKIPSSIGNLTMLTELYLDVNKLEGTIPSSLGNCKQLLVLTLSQNNLNGSIPKQLFDLSSLSQALLLDQNHLSGQLPQEIGNLKHLATLSLGDNDFSGVIPISIGDCESLQSLNLEGNLFQGSIPTSLSSLRGLEDLDLSRNNFSGQIPRFLEELLLNSLNLSFNNFEGDVPIQGVFTNLSAISIVGNTRLCGGVPGLHLPKCTTKEFKKGREKYHALKIVILIICLLLGIGTVSFFLFYFLKKKRKTQPSELLLKESFPQVSYEKLLKATDGFSSENLIGSGGFGFVYKGTIDDDDGTIVAVKVLNLQNRGASKSFTAECEALRNIRHRNLVKTTTSCSSIDFQGNDFKALVYEFMPNGSLEKWLHASPQTINGQDEFLRLGLLQRINIAIDVGYALDYLHHECGNPIIHCDLKPSNILLDGDMMAHVGDFGLAKILLPEIPNPNQSSSIGVRGTFGYAAPEYGLGSEVSANGDAYSFGILLLEMMTGKRPIHPIFQDGLNLHNHARMALPDGVMEIVEPVLLTEHEDDMASTVTTNGHGVEQANYYKKRQECLISMVKLGVACSMESPHDRMDIRKVIHELNSIKTILVQT